MKVTINKIWSTIVLICLFLLVLLSTSCRIAKKEWVKENFTEKEIINNTLKAKDSTTSIKVLDIYKKLSELETSIASSQTTSTSQSENETTTISGSLTAEAGKEKTVTIGNTTITSNGANVSFETVNTKALSKAFESKYQELTAKLQVLNEINEKQETQINSLKSEINNLKSNYTSLKNNQIKNVSKTGGTLGFTSIALIIILAITAFLFFKKQIPFLN
jgi:predicted nuclease with TOPRIM domain